MTYVPSADRYDRMQYRRSGRSGLQLPAVSLGLWHNFGHDRPWENGRAIVRRAFDLGIIHHDLANNYGPPYGSAEENYGRIFKHDLRPYRDELVISTKAGYDMWPGPYGSGGGTRKYVLASLDQSLAPDGPRVRRHLLLAPLRPRHSARGDDRGTRHGGEAGQGALRRHLLLLAREDPRGGGDRPQPRHADRDPPAVLLDAEPLDRAGAARHARGRRDRLHRFLAARAGRPHRPLPGRDPGGVARGHRGHRALRGSTERADDGEGARAERDRDRGAARRSPRWRSRGRCATRG